MAEMQTPMDKEEMFRELRRRFEWLSRFSDDELRELAFCTDEGRLSESDQYFDLSDPERGPFIAREGESIPEGSCYVSRHEIRDDIWVKLTA